MSDELKARLAQLQLEAQAIERQLRESAALSDGEQPKPETDQERRQRLGLAPSCPLGKARGGMVHHNKGGDTNGR